MEYTQVSGPKDYEYQWGSFAFMLLPNLSKSAHLTYYAQSGNLPKESNGVDNI